MDVRATMESKQSRSIAKILVILALFTAPNSLEATQQGTGTEARIRWEPYELRVGDERRVSAELGRLTVPERRDKEEGGTVELAFVRLRARGDAAGPPVVYLDGGPGGSGVGIAEVPDYYRLFDDLRVVGDVILLSQRGAGLTSPRLACPLAALLPDDLFVTRERMLEALEPSVAECAETWRRRGVDLGGYTTRESADDLEALRRALGASRLHLLAFSYGTHLALDAMRRHEDRIGRAVLLGTEGPDHSYKLPSTLDMQLRHLSRLVAGDRSARNSTPDLFAAVDSLVNRLDREPVALTVEGDEGERMIRVGGDGMRYLLRRDIGDTNDLPLWPAAVRMTLDGDYRMLTALAERRFREIAGIPLMGMLMDCASGATEPRLNRIADETTGSIIGVMTESWFPEVCAVLPEARLDSDFRSRFTSGVPTLFLSGTLDANAPPYQASFVSWGWPEATHLVVENAGHETLFPYRPVQEVIVDHFRGEDVSDRSIPAPPLDFLGVDEVERLLAR